MKTVREKIIIFYIFNKNQYHLADAFERFSKVLKGFETYWFTTKFTVVIGDPDDVKTALNADESFEKAFMYNLFFHDGLLVERKDNYKFHKKILNPIFNPAVLHTFVPKLNMAMDKVFKNYKIEGKTFDVRGMVFVYACRGAKDTILCNSVQELPDAVFEGIRTSAERYELFNLQDYYKD